jgi:hypothetical protein
VSLTRRVPLRRRKPLRAKGKPRPTKAEGLRIVKAKFGPCVVCLRWARMGRMPETDVMQGGDYHHPKSGNVRRGHRLGFCNCPWHHRGVPSTGWTSARMRSHFGPSLMDGSRLFHTTYGSDDDLIALQDEILGEESDAAA